MRPHEKHLGGNLTVGRTAQNKKGLSYRGEGAQGTRRGLGISVFQRGASYLRHSGGKGGAGLSLLGSCLRSQINRARLRTGAQCCAEEGVLFGDKAGVEEALGLLGRSVDSDRDNTALLRTASSLLGKMRPEDSTAHVGADRNDVSNSFQEA